MSLKRGAKRLLSVGIAVAAFALTFVATSSAVTGGSGGTTLPPGGVYTCGWIAANPAAAARAGVTCDPSAVPPVSRSTIATPDSVDANGCQHVPAGGGRVGKGVWAWLSTYEYASWWSFWGNWYPTYYTFYIQKTNGVNYTSGEVFDTSTRDVNVPANVYRWGAQNHSTTAENWEACYVG